MGGLDVSSKARKEVAAMSKVYLKALDTRAHKDQDLAVEVSEAYSLLARVQGISFDASPAQQAEAEQSLRQASAFVEASLAKAPNNRKALLVAARIRHHHMAIAQANGRIEDTLAHAKTAVTYLDRLLQQGQLSDSESETTSQLFNDVALAHKNAHRYQQAILYARRSIDVARFSARPHLRLSHGLSQLANLLRLSADMDGALQAIREARGSLELARFPSETVRRSSLALILSREGMILGAASGISLDQPGKAIPLFRQAFDLIEAWTQDDPEDAWSRMLFATLGRCYGDILRQRDPKAAMAIYDHSLVRLREVQNNAEARRGEAEILAGSSYALRQLRHFDGSRTRIDAAVRLLTETHDYPTNQVTPHNATYEVIRALGDHLADTDQPGKASDVYRDLLEKLMQSEPDPQNNIAHAVALSHIHGSLASWQRRTGDFDRAAQHFDARMQLWQHWDRQLPRNGVILRQLALARITK
jgi:tetratricopeptide (TPR) repeat protein